MGPETKQSIRCDRAFWQRVAVGAVTVGAIGNILLGAQCFQYKTEANRWRAEAEITETVKDDALAAVGRLVDKCQELEAQMATPVQQAATTDAETYAAGRYAPITAEERELLARLVFLEAGAASFECQRACAEVVLNRVAAENFPDTVEAVIYQEGQFTPAPRISGTTATEEQYRAVDAALEGDNLTPADVVYFSTTGENDRVWGTIDGVVFCRQYSWAVDAS